MKANIQNKLGMAVGSILLLGMSPANAAHPASVAGTWETAADQTTGALVITQSATAAVCKPISGTIFGGQIQGYYCPAEGRILFARLNNNGSAFQFYEGHVSRDGVVVYIGGSFAVWNILGGGATDEGKDFSFVARK